MKKSVMVLIGAAVIVPPLIAASTIGGPINPNFGSYLSFSAISQSIRFPNSNVLSNGTSGLLSSLIESQKPNGTIGSVTYFGKREGKNEVLDIYLDSQTISADDYCFLMVNVKNSEGETEYVLETTIVRFKGSTHYLIELDPPKLENETKRTVKVCATFYSCTASPQQEINFEIDYTEKKEFIYEDNTRFTSSYPIAIKYTQKGKEEKIYESFNFDSICNLNYKRPIFSVEDIRFTYSYSNMEIMLPNYNECYLLIDEVFDNSDFEDENDMKKVPLSLVYENGVISFSLIDEYYYDSGDGMIYRSDNSGRKAVNNLILPTTYNCDNAIYYELHLKGLSSSESDFIFKSYASFDVKWFGSCDDSYFCVSKVDELLEDAYYSGGVII